MKYKSDITIIGAGMVGVTIATLLKIRKPDMSITLIDKNMVGLGTTSYSAGLSTPLAKSAVSRNFIGLGKNVLVEIKKAIGIDVSLLRAIYIVGEADLEKFNSLYVDSDLIPINSSDGLNISINKHIKVLDNQCMMSSSQGAHCINPYYVSEKMCSFLRSQSQLIFESCDIKKIEYGNDFNTIYFNKNDTVMTRKIIYSLGPWRQTSPLILAKSNARNKKVVAIHIDLIPKAGDSVIIFFDEDAFLLPVHDKGYWLFSFASREWDVSPEDDLVISDQDLADAKVILDRVSTNLSNKIMGGRVFCDNYSENREFDITMINDSTMEISGASGSGYRLAYGLAETVVQKVCNEK